MSCENRFPQHPEDERLRRLVFAVMLQALDDACGYDLYWATDACSWLEENMELFFDFLHLDSDFMPEIIALMRQGDRAAKEKLRQLRPLC